jgi:hypothetical protein
MSIPTTRASSSTTGKPLTWSPLTSAVYKRLVQKVRGNAGSPGEYRHIQNYVANSLTKGNLYTPPAPLDVPVLWRSMRRNYSAPRRRLRCFAGSRRLPQLRQRMSSFPTPRLRVAKESNDEAAQRALLSPIVRREQIPAGMGL